MKSLKRKIFFSGFLTRLTTVCSVFLLPLFLLSSAKAQDTEIPNGNRASDMATGAVLIPWQFVERWVDQKMGSNDSSTLIDEKIENVDFTVSDIPVHIPSVRLQASGGFQPVQVVGNVTRWSSDFLNVNLQLDGFTVEKEFVKDVDGATVIVTLKAQCQPFQMQQDHGSFSTSLAWKAVDFGFDLSAEDLQLSWSEDSWQIGAIHCEGAENFGQVVQTELENFLKNPDALEASLRPVIEQRLNALIALALEPLKKPVWLDNNRIFLAKTSRTQVINDRGLAIFAQIETNPDVQNPIAGVNEVPLILGDEVWGSVTNQPVLVLPQGFFESTARHAKIFSRVETHLNDLPAFRKILNSRFLQWLFWPELRKFKKDAPFDAVSMIQGQEHAIPTNIPHAQFMGGQKIAVSASISTWIKAERDGQPINWAYINTDIKGNIKYSLQNGEMVFALENPNLQMTAQHMPEYLEKYPNHHKFPMGRIKDAMQEQLAQRSFRFSLPVLDLQSIGALNPLKAKSVTEMGKNLIFTFEPIQF